MSGVMVVHIGVEFADVRQCISDDFGPPLIFVSSVEADAAEIRFNPLPVAEPADVGKISGGVLKLRKPRMIDLSQSDVVRSEKGGEIIEEPLSVAHLHHVFEAVREIRNKSWSTLNFSGLKP